MIERRNEDNLHSKILGGAAGTVTGALLSAFAPHIARIPETPLAQSATNEILHIAAVGIVVTAAFSAGANAKRHSEDTDDQA